MSNTSAAIRKPGVWPNMRKCPAETRRTGRKARINKDGRKKNWKSPEMLCGKIWIIA